MFKKINDKDFLKFISKIILGVSGVTVVIFLIALNFYFAAKKYDPVVSDDFDEIVFYRVSSRGRPAGVETYRMVDEHTGREYIVLHDRGTSIAVVDAEPKEIDNGKN